MKRSNRDPAKTCNLMPVLWILTACVFSVLLPFTTKSQLLPSAPSLLPGQTATRLPDGKLLLLGGESGGGVMNTASIWNPTTNNTTQLAGTMDQGRAWHTATVLPDGLVLVLGGVGESNQVVSTAELFHPATETFTVLPAGGVTPRARHSATLLSDGHVLIAGGVGSNGEALRSAELWDAIEPASAAIPSSALARRNHTSTLLPDGRVLLWGGSDGAGSPLTNGEIFDPSTQRFTAIDSYPSALFPQSGDAPALVASIPIDRTLDVDPESMISLRFSKPLRVETVNERTVSLSGPKGIEKISVVPAENGSLAFITPESILLPGAAYTVSINGAIDRDGLLLPVSGISFSTKGLTGGGSTPGNPAAGTGLKPISTPSESPMVSSDDDSVWKGKLKDGKPHSDWEDLPPLKAPDGVTALAGQVLDLKGMPLAKVKIEIESEYGQPSVSTQTDDTGRFLLSNIEAGWHELIIDGRVAQRRVAENSQALGPKENHGVFEYGYKIKEGETTVLPFTIWLPKIDTLYAVKIPSPTTAEVIVTNPKIPGLELRIASGTTITDHEGETVREVSLTPIPLDRTPFPLPKDVTPPVYFTAQPGGAYLANSGKIGARIYYPNTFKQLPGTRHRFWHYDPGYRGWYVYGLGTVDEEGKQIVPDPGISVHEFTGAMVQNPGNAPADGPKPSCEKPECKPGDPVDATTGLFVLNKTDLYVVDGILPIEFTRTYRPGDTFSRAFGIGTSHSYDLFFVGDTSPYTYVDLILPDGGRIHYDRISAGTSYADAVYEHTLTSTKYYKSRVTWNGVGWDLKLKDGTLLKFDDGNSASRPGQGGVLSITTRTGAQTTISRDSQGNVTRITSPGGRWIEFTNVNNRITQAKDNIGRTVTYEYDATGRLIKVTDPNGGTNEYTYDTSSRMLTLKDARGIVFLTNEYDATGKVNKQTMVDSGEYLFTYTMNGSNVSQLDVTDPRGKVSRTTLNTAGQILSHTKALGTAEEQVTTYQVQSGTNFVLSKTDALNRTTSYTYDSMGNITSVTGLAGTADAVTTTFTYEPTFNQMSSMTDPLNHTTTFGYDSKGSLMTVTNALNQTTTIGRNSAGQVTSVTDPLNNTRQYTYDFGDFATFTDPLNNTSSRFTDSAGRVLGVTDPLGNLSIYDYDVLNRLTKVTDPINGQTNFGYPNGNLLSVTDARSNQTTYTYNNMDYLATRVDPLTRSEGYQYDLNGNISQFTDRKSQVSIYTYDGINRRTGVTYADTSTTTYTYDKGNRLTQVVDSIAGTITRTYDGLNRITSETTPQGSVSYTYDAASRRATMTVAGQSTVNYTYDNANRLTQITQGSSTVTYAYDAAGRRTSLTLPNNVLVEYGYDNASRLTSITYKQNGTTVLGDLTYEYDKNGNRIKTGGSFSRTGIPQTVATTAYNAANHQTTFGDKTLTYDNNGNLQTITDSSGTTTYTWNARNQLVGISGPGVNATFVYDGLGRREKKTINSNLTEFLYDGVNPVQETSGAAILANVLPGLGIDEFLTRTDVVAGVTSNFLTDALGSPIAVTDNAGAIQTDYTYEPFGKTAFSGSSNSSSYQYTGRENDGTGLLYYRNRYYHPQFQRFVSEDPIELDGEDVNLYAYVWNSPLEYTDPSGFSGNFFRVPKYTPRNPVGNPSRTARPPGKTGPVKNKTPRPKTRPANPGDGKQPNRQFEDKLPGDWDGPNNLGCVLLGSMGPGCSGSLPPMQTPPPGSGRGKDDPPSDPLPDHPICKAAPELCPDPRA